MIISLRTDGFTDKHWEMLVEEFDLPHIDGKQATLADLIRLELFKDKFMDRIKYYSDFSMKEYSFVKSFEMLERDVKSAKFSFQKYKMTQTSVLIGLDDQIGEFEEFKIKCVSLLTNVFAKGANLD